MLAIDSTVASPSLGAAGTRPHIDCEYRVAGAHAGEAGIVAALDDPGGAAITAGNRPAAEAAAGSTTPAATNAPLDDTAESVPDTAATLAESFARRAEVVMFVQQSEQQVMQARLDRMKADFNATQEERTEQLREMNALRDMALAQAKQDDEVLKKYIAMI